MEATRGNLLKVREAAHDRDKMDPGAARSIIESAYLAIEKNMLDAVPWPEVASRETRAPCGWHASIRFLNDIQRRLGRPHYSASATNVIKPLNKTWRKALLRTISLSRARASRKSLRTAPIAHLHQFCSSPSTWASSLGFNSSSCSEWLSTSHIAKDVTASNACGPLLGYPQVAIHRTSGLVQTIRNAWAKFFLSGLRQGKPLPTTLES